MSFKRIHILDTDEPRRQDGIDAIVGCGKIVPKAVAIAVEPEDEESICGICKSVIVKGKRHYQHYLVPGEEVMQEKAV